MISEMSATPNWSLKKWRLASVEVFFSSCSNVAASPCCKKLQDNRVIAGSGNTDPVAVRLFFDSPLRAPDHGVNGVERADLNATEFLKAEALVEGEVSGV